MSMVEPMFRCVKCGETVRWPSTWASTCCGASAASAIVVAAIHPAQGVDLVEAPSLFMDSPFFCVDRRAERRHGLGSETISLGGTNWRLVTSGG